MESDLRQLCQDFFGKYNVKDLIYPKSEILFILESPHKAEIKEGYPVAGSSGLEMTKFIYGPTVKEAFGKLVSQADRYNKQYPNLKKFSILNISPVPMQASALANFKLKQSEKDLLAVLEKLRANYKTENHRAKKWNLVKSELLKNFQDRLKTTLATSEIKYLIPCGKLATAYLDLIEPEIEQDLKIIRDIPHPSFNQWSYFASLERLKDLIDKLEIKAGF